MKNKPRSDLSILLEDSIETFYWIGFILADGCVTNNKLVVDLSCLDKEHLYKLATYLKTINVINRTSKNRQYVRINCRDIINLPKICNKFDLKTKKTYNPPNKFEFSKDLLLSMFIGYIDGDGSIQTYKNRKDFILKFHIHSSWRDWLIKFQNLLESELNLKLPSPIITKAGFCSWVISQTKVLIFLKKFIIKNNIPALERKWIKVNENFISKFDISKDRKEKFLSLQKDNLSRKQIASIIGCSLTHVNNMYRDLNEVSKTN